MVWIRVSCVNQLIFLWKHIIKIYARVLIIWPWINSSVSARCTTFFVNMGLMHFIMSSMRLFCGKFYHHQNRLMNNNWERYINLTLSLSLRECSPNCGSFWMMCLIFGHHCCMLWFIQFRCCSFEVLYTHLIFLIQYYWYFVFNWWFSTTLSLLDSPSSITRMILSFGNI